MATPYTSLKLNAQELAEIHSLPDDALVTPQEAAAFLRLQYNTLAWYRSHGGGPKHIHMGRKLIRYRLGDLREFAMGQPMSECMRKVGAALLASRKAKVER